MTTITTRSGKGSPLTNDEVDANFTNLNDDKVEASGDSMTGDLSFGDNNKAIFGAGSDLQIYHTPTGNHSIITESGSGNLILAADNLEINNAANNANKIVATTGGAVTLFHNNSAKLATTSTGIDVTGQIVADGADFQGQVQFNGTAGVQLDNGAQVHTWVLDDNFTSRFNIGTSSAAAAWIFGSNNANYWTVSPSGVVVNQDGADTDFRVESTSNDHMLFVNAGANRVGIGESNPQYTLHATSSGTTLTRLESTDAGAGYGPYLDLRRTSASPIDGDGLGAIVFTGQDSGANGTTYAQIRAEASDVTDGTEDGLLSFRTIVGGSDTARLNLTLGESVFNEQGVDLDFRVESDTNEYALFVDAGNSRVGINESSPDAPLHITASTSATIVEALRIENTASGGQEGNSIVFNPMFDGKATIAAQRHAGNANGTEMFFTTDTTGATTVEHLRFATGSNTVFNESSAEIDFRVESNNNTHMLFVDAGADKIGVNTASPQQLLHVNSSAITYMRATGGSGNTGVDFGQHSNASGYIWHRDDAAVIIGTNETERVRFGSSTAGETVFNEGGDDFDFRVESDSNANMLFVDAGNNHVNIGTSTDFGGALNVNGGLNSKQAVFTSTNNRGLALSTATRSGQNDGVAIVDAQDTEATGGRLELHTMGAERARFERDQIVFNDNSGDQDFRVESNSNTHAIFVNAGADGVGFGATASTVGSSTIEGMYYEIGGSLTVASNTETLQINRNNTGGNNRVNIGLYNNGTKRGEIGTYGAADGMFFYTGSTVDSLRLTAGEAVFNDGGDDVNFRVESDTLTHALFVDAGSNAIGINNSAPSGVKLSVHGQTTAAVAWGDTSDRGFLSFDGSGNPVVRANSGLGLKLQANASTDIATFGDPAANYSIVFNDNGSPSIDFRVESDNNSLAFVVDAATDQVCIGRGATSQASADLVTPFGGRGVLLESSDGSVAQNEYIDMAVNNTGGGYQGLLTVANTRTDNAGQRTQTTFFIAGRGTDAVATSIGTDNGSSGGASFTVTFPSNGVMRITNTLSATTALTAVFIGGSSF
jgi:hypothetical protein